MKRLLLPIALLLVAAAALPMALGQRGRRPARRRRDRALEAKRARLRAALKKLPYRIVYESYNGSDWDLMIMKADGSQAAHLTRTPEVDELYPHLSPNGKTVAFMADEGAGRAKARNLYLMDLDDPQADPRRPARRLVAAHARHPAWGPFGKRLAYTPDEYRRFSYDSYATRYIQICDLATGTHTRHPNPRLHHLYALKWSPDGKWFLATVHGAMGYRDADLAIEVEGKRAFQLKSVTGCRPDVRPDGKKLLWNLTDQAIVVADFDPSRSPPLVRNARKVVSCDQGWEVYHGDWSPDGKYIAFSHGPEGHQCPGLMAKGWQIFVADASDTNVCVRLTSGGVSNKEPDWVPVAPAREP